MSLSSLLVLSASIFSLTYGALSPHEVSTLESEITSLIQEKNCAPILIRLAWHDSGTYDKNSNTGGPRAAMRFSDGGESTHGANAGLDVARGLLAPLEAKYCNGESSSLGRISVADLWSFAGTIAIKASGGPSIPFRFGRSDAPNAAASVEEGRLPDGDKGLSHLQQVFYKMGLNDREIVALSGAHTLGSCHSDRSGFKGPWTNEPYKFDNSYFKDIIGKKWVETKVSETGNPQFRADPDDGTMMLSTDLALYKEAATKGVVEEYAASQEKFFQEFANAWQKLVELGYSDAQLYQVASVKSEL